MQKHRMNWMADLGEHGAWMDSKNVFQNRGVISRGLSGVPMSPRSRKFLVALLILLLAFSAIASILLYFV